MAKKRTRNSLSAFKNNTAAKTAVGVGLALAAVGAVALTVGLSKRAAARRAAYSEASQSKLVERVDSAAYEKERIAKQKQERREKAKANAWTLFTGTLSFVFTVALQFLSFMLTTLFAKLTLGPIGGILGFLADVLLNFILIALLFAILYKRLFPERSLRELFTLKNIGWMLLGALALSGLRVATSLLLPKYLIWGAIAQSLLSVAVLCFVWYKAFKQTGYFGSQIKKTLFSKTGAVTFLSLLLSSVAFALVKVLLSSLSVVGPYAQIAVLFAITAAVCYGGYRLIRSVQNRLDVSVLLKKSETEQLYIEKV